MSQTKEASEVVGTEGVVVLHGIMRSARSMSGISGHLRSRGYDVLNKDYPSTRMPLEELPKHIHEDVAALASRVSRLSFVGFSMGGLVIRAYLNAYRPANLGRVVMLGTPNNGSEVADLLKDHPLYRRFLGAAGQQLVTDQSQFSNVFGTVDYELGVIAGRNIMNPVADRIFRAPNDGKVSVASTHLAGCRDHIVIRRNHTFLPMSRAGWVETAHFLQNGAFTSKADRVIA